MTAQESLPQHKHTNQISVPPVAGFLQFDVQQGAVEENVGTVCRLLDKLTPPAGAVILLPELWATGFAYDRLDELAGHTPELLKKLQNLAAEHDILLAGSLPEQSQTETGTCFFNTLFVTGPQGPLGSYRKQRLFAPMGEDQHFTAGDCPAPINTAQGKLAGLVCYDLRFPELAKLQAAQGAGLLLISAQWPAARLHHWRTLIQARAIENQMFVAACNRTGTTGDTTFAGHSMIVAPDGTILTEADDQEATGSTRLDADLLAQARGLFNTMGPSPYAGHDRDKFINLPSLKQQVEDLKKTGCQVVFTNGCFDILHTGHVTYLEQARKQGDCLIIGLNSDASVRSLEKGDDRPVNRQEDRARLLAALGCVDYVVLFEEETPLNLITTLMPDILAKGGDWPVEKIVGGAEVVAAGGRVLSIPLVADYSTTSLLERIREEA